MENLGPHPFTETLTGADVDHRLPYPSSLLQLLPFGEGVSSADFYAKDVEGLLWRFRCSIRTSGTYKKLVISGGWLSFVKSFGGVRAGDEVVFFQNKDPDEALFVISVRKRVRLFDVNAGVLPFSNQHQAQNQEYSLSNLPTSPIYSNQDEWFDSMLQSCMLYQRESHLDESAHLLELHGSSSGGGETRKRRRSTSVEDAADSGNDKEAECYNRQVKCRPEPTQSDATLYLSVSEGESASTGCSSQESITLERTATFKDVVYRGLGRIFDFLHQLKNYVG